MISKILSVSAAAVFAFALPASAGAQTPLGWHVRYDSGPSQYYSRRYEDGRRVARDKGYQEGLHHGDQAARRRKPFDLNREKDYRNGDEGYRREYGSREEYREAFRSGFAEGYREAYDRDGYRVRGGSYYTAPRAPEYNGAYGSVGVYGQVASVAFQNGQNDGYNRGVDDARHGRYPDVDRQGWYRSGSRGYNRRYGSRDAYRVEYRRGFDEGYRRAFGR